MKCPNCSKSEDKVLESRSVQDNELTRRRRECLHCNFRFTTFERIEEMPIKVLKKNGKEELFNLEKIHSGILRACRKRSVSLDQVKEVVNEIDSEVRAMKKNKINSDDIGTLILKHLHQLDHVAYIRFASVYREFHDVSEFIKEVNNIAVQEQI